MHIAEFSDWMADGVELSAGIEARSVLGFGAV